MSLINQHSFLISAAFINLLAAFFILRGGVTPWRVLGVLGVAVVLGLIWWVVRPRQSDLVEISRVEGHIGGGVPVLLEFQSPY